MPEINKHYTVKEGVETYPRKAMVKTIYLEKHKDNKIFYERGKILKNTSR